MITEILGPVIMFFALRLILTRYMTSKNNFYFRDKIILTLGGFIVLDILAAMQDDMFLFIMSLPFFVHWIILISPHGLKKWKEFIRMLKIRWRL